VCSQSPAPTPQGSILSDTFYRGSRAGVYDSSAELRLKQDSGSTYDRTMLFALDLGVVGFSSAQLVLSTNEASQTTSAELQFQQVVPYVTTLVNGTNPPAVLPGSSPLNVPLATYERDQTYTFDLTPILQGLLGLVYIRLVRLNSSSRLIRCHSLESPSDNLRPQLVLT
jgi:hypothetical protein